MRTKSIHSPSSSRKKSTKSSSSSSSASEDDVPTGVDGQGMWRSWTRVFLQPASAALDLLDNCLDAAVTSDTSFQGRVTLTEFPFHNSIVIHNNSSRPIRPLQDALTVYQTHKSQTLHHTTSTTSTSTASIPFHKDTIGENGVGLKQGAACLSDCSLILTRHQSTIEVGILAQALQTPHRIHLPWTKCFIHQRTNHIQSWLQRHENIRQCLLQAFQTESTEQLVHEVLLELMERLFLPPFQDSPHSFLLVLTNIRQPTTSTSQVSTSSESQSNTTNTSNNNPQHMLFKQEEENNDNDHSQTAPPTPSEPSPSQAFLDHLTQLLPQYYIHLPNFPLAVRNTPIRFDYWATRLVELTRYVVDIPRTVSLEEWWDVQKDTATTTQSDDITQQQSQSFPTYPLHIYCGFDALRVHDDMAQNRSSPCQLYVYSRTAGRRIVHERDARHILGLSTGGVDYTQGLTVLLVDTQGQLPLTPTKDGLAWSEQALHGQNHQRNVYAWAGACAHVFWQYHIKTFTKLARSSHAAKHRKQALKETIASFVEPHQRTLRRSVQERNDNNDDDDDDGSTTLTEASLPVDNLQTANLTTFPDIQWKVVTSSQGITWVRPTKSPSELPMQRGSDTLYNLQEGFAYRRQVARASTVAASSSSRQPSNASAVARKPPRASLESVMSWDENEAGDGFQSNVQQVGRRVLNYLRSQESHEVFENPVLETYPEIKDEYLEAVSQPMDFWTIDQKLADYQDTSELKRDVQLVYSNCIAYNGEESHLTKIAKYMLNSLDDIFANSILGKRCRKRIAPKSWDSPSIDARASKARSNPSSKAKSSLQRKQAPSVTSLQTKNRQLEAKVKEQNKLIQKLQEQIQELQQQSSQLGEGCQICGQDNRPEDMLLCDQCNGEFHRGCLDPPLEHVPKGYWYCADCGGV